VKISYTKSSGKPFAHFTIEDFNGSVSFPVFGKDYENFMQYTQQNLPLLLKCAIAPKFGYDAAKQEGAKNVDYELKIKSIRHLANTKEDFIKQITINIPIRELNGGLRKELTNRFKENKGSTAVIIKALDYENQLAVEFFSTKYKVSLTNDLFGYLDSIPLEYSFTPTLSF
jgi:DNA polymerase-3 subunit alpha